jgi:MFS superfamily sulfate permease-like transporter
MRAALSRLAALRRPSEWNAGLAGTAAYLAAVLTQGLLAYGALGPAGLAIGIPAALLSAALGGCMLALLARSALPAGGPGAALGLIYSALILSIVKDPSFDLGNPGQVRALVALGAAAVAGCGLLQLAFAGLGVARLAKFVPQPVLAGFMNGIAALLLISQLPALLGLPLGAGAAQTTAWPAQVQPLTLTVALVTAGLYFAFVLRWPRLPGALLALLFGTALYHVLPQLWPGAALGPAVGPVPAGLLNPGALLPLFGPDGAALVLRHGAAVLATAGVLAVVGTLECVLTTLSIDQRLDERSDPGHELRVYGLTNVVCGCLGGLPVVPVRGRAWPTLLAGGRTPAAIFAGSVFFALLGLFGGGLIAWLPVAALAGVMVVVSYTLIDRWTGQLLRQWRAGGYGRAVGRDLAVVALVFAFTLGWGFVAGVAAGLLASMLLFIGGMNRSLIRSRCSAAAQPSRRMRAAAEEAVLAPARRSIEIIELEGALFFGSADRLAELAADLPAGCSALVLDCRRIGSIDASGALVLAQTERALARRGIVLHLAGVTESGPHGRALRAAGTFLERPCPAWFDDTDRAVEAAEDALLAAAAVPCGDGHVAPVDSDLMRGLTPPQCVLLAARLRERRLAAGERLFAAGDAADCLYVISEGSVSIVSDPSPRDGTVQRYVSFSPGKMFGELALLDGGGRSAHALADRPACVHALSQQDLHALAAADPALVTQVYRNLAVHLAQRLRFAADAWRASNA